MKIIKFGLFLIFLAFIKRISSLGKRVRVNIPKEKPFASEDKNELENTKLLELKKSERVRFTARTPKQDETEKIEELKKPKESDEKEKDGINVNINIEILNKRCADDERRIEAKPSSNIRTTSKPIKEREVGKKEEEKIISNLQKPNDEPKKDLGLSNNLQKEFLKETNSDLAKTDSLSTTKSSEAIDYPNKNLKPSETTQTIVKTNDQGNKSNDGFLSPATSQVSESKPITTQNQTQVQSAQSQNSAGKPNSNPLLASNSPANSPNSLNTNPNNSLPKPAQPQNTSVSNYRTIVFGLESPMSVINPSLEPDLKVAEDINAGSLPTQRSSFLSDISL